MTGDSLFEFVFFEERMVIGFVIGACQRQDGPGDGDELFGSYVTTLPFNCGADYPTLPGAAFTSST